MRKSFVKLIFVVAVIIITAVLFSSSYAQGEDTYTPPDGKYTGVMVMSGKFGIPSEAFAEQGVQGEIVWVGAGSGTVELAVEGGYGTGIWEFEGDGLIGGFFQDGEYVVDVEGQNIFGGAGEMEGNFSRPLGKTQEELIASLTENGLRDVNLTGESWGESTVTVTAGDFAQTTTDDYEEPVEVIFRYNTVSCNQIQGTWLEDAEAELSAANLAPDLEGVWSVVQDEARWGETGKELDAKIANLLRQSLDFKDQFDRCEPVDEGQFSDWLRDIYSLLRSLKKDFSCELAKNKVRFLYPVSYAACTATGAYFVNSLREDCISPVGADMNMLFYGTIGLTCINERYLIQTDDLLERVENDFLERISNLDLSTPEGRAEMLQVADAADALNFTRVKAAIKEAWANYSTQGGGE
jgi:hypothetical protein